MKKLFAMIILASFMMLSFTQSAFGYWSSPKVNLLSPNNGTNNEIVELTITGDKFKKATSVKLVRSGEVDIVAENINYISKNKIICIINLRNKPVGRWDVVVTNYEKFLFIKWKKKTIINKGFILDYSYALKNPSPTVRKVNLQRGFDDGSVLVIINGTNFDKNTTVKLIGSKSTDILGTDVKVKSTTELSCFFNIRDKTLGNYAVALRNPDGQLAFLPGGFVVESFAKPINSKQQLKSLFFDYDQSELRFDQLGNAEVNLSKLKDNPGLYAILGGYADERGTQEYNLQLSAERVATVKQYLIDKGISSDRIISYFYGKEHPVEQGNNESYWWHNRRVDILMWETVLSKDRYAQAIDHSARAGNNH
jgi:outer membrane protein OmpA-like peptidoglycan-associated protein